MTADPSITVIVPTFQRREMVLALVERMETITYRGDWEAVVVVDGATDGTTETLRALAPGFRLAIVEQGNGGAAAARNAGAAYARSDVLLFLDDDMSFDPGLLDAYGEVFRHGADAACGEIVLDPGSRRGFLTGEMADWLSQRSSDLHSGEPLSPFWVTSGNMAIRSSVFSRLAGFDPGYTANGGYGAEDVDLGFRLRAGQFQLVACPSARVAQRYDIGPSQALKRSALSAASELRLIQRHPAAVQLIKAMRRMETRKTRWVVRPMARIASLVKLWGRLAIRLAERCDSLPDRIEAHVPRIFSQAASLAYWAELNRLGGPRLSSQAVVLCYHAIAHLPEDGLMGPYAVAPAQFERQIDSLLARGFNFVTPGEFASFVEQRTPLPRKAVLVTFDDCYEDLASVARNVLAKRGIRALAFAVARRIGGANDWDTSRGARKMRLLDADSLRSLEREGIEIGCHSGSHFPLAGLAPDRLVEETEGAAGTIGRATGHFPRFFAYPYGVHDEASRKAVGDVFLAGFGTRNGMVDTSSDRRALPRVTIMAAHSPLRFFVATTFPRQKAAIEYGYYEFRERLRVYKQRLGRSKPPPD